MWKSAVHGLVRACRAITLKVKWKCPLHLRQGNGLTYDLDSSPRVKVEKLQLRYRSWHVCVFTR